MVYLHVETVYPHDDEHAHRPDLMERLHEVRLAAEAQGVELPEDWRDHIEMPDAVKVTWTIDTEALTMHPVAVERAAWD